MAFYPEQSCYRHHPEDASQFPNDLKANSLPFNHAIHQCARIVSTLPMHSWKAGNGNNQLNAHPPKCVMAPNSGRGKKNLPRPPNEPSKSHRITALYPQKSWRTC